MISTLSTLLVILRTRAQVQPAPNSLFCEACGLVWANTFNKNATDIDQYFCKGHISERVCEK